MKTFNVGICELLSYQQQKIKAKNQLEAEEKYMDLLSHGMIPVVESEYQDIECVETTRKQIKTIAQLNKILKDGHFHEFAMMLAEGAAFSRKSILYIPKQKKYRIQNHIDDSWQKLTARQLMDEEYTNIGISMKSGGFWTI